MIARVRKWGNSLAVRLPRKELDRLHIQEGDEVDIKIRPAAAPTKVDLGHLTMFEDDRPFAQARKEYYRRRLD